MHRKNSYIEKAKKFGIDISLIEINLKRTPTERVIALQNALTFAEALSQAGANYYAKLRKTN